MLRQMRTQEYSNITPTHKVGIKLMDEGQLINVFPNYQNLLKKIEIHREAISGLEVCPKKHYQYNLMYDNVFSILGKRGTGKTSAVFTIQKMLEEDKRHPYDIVLPIIIPEVIPKECSALGWLLAIVREEIEKTENQVNNTQKDDFFKNCRHESSLLHKVDELTELCFSEKYNPSREASFYKVLGNAAKQAQNYYSFSRQITELWDQWIDTIKKNNRVEEPPLIYFIFDDVDLAPEKVEELLSIIIKYLSHPNVIVITTADEELFLETIENNLDQSIGRLPKEWRNYLNENSARTGTMMPWTVKNEPMKENQDLITRTARMYMGKVMPTSTRYYLQMFRTAEQKQFFRLDENENLYQAICKLMDELIDSIGKSNKNFMKPNGKSVNFYLHFMGNTSRQIANAFYGIRELVDSLTSICKKEKKTEDAYVEELYRAFYHFLCVEVNANHELAELAEEAGNLEMFVSELFWGEYVQWRLYINYTFIREFLNELAIKNYSKGKIIRIALQIYSLAFFVENILLIMEQHMEITGRRKIHGIPGMVEFLCGYVFSEKRVFRAELEANKFFLHYSSLLNKLEYIAENDKKEIKFNVEYFYDFIDYEYEEKDMTIQALQILEQESKLWFGEMIERMSLVYGNVYLFGQHEMEKCKIYQSERGLSLYQNEVRNILNNTILNCLTPFDVLQTALEEIEDLKWSMDMYEEIEGESFSSFCTDEVDDIAGFYGDWNPSLSDVIDYFNQVYGGSEIHDILDVCPKNFRDRIVHALPILINSRSRMEAQIKEIIVFIEQWDYSVHALYIHDVSTFMDNMSKLSRRVDVESSQRINQIMDALLKQFQNSDDKDRYKIFPFMYTELRDIMKKIDRDEERKNMEFGEYGESIEEYIKNILSIMDVGVCLDNVREREAAIELSIIIQLLKRLLHLYIYQVITEKYQSGYNLSSGALEKMVVKKATRRRKQVEKNSYYYSMYLLLKKIIEDDLDENDEITEELSNQIPVLRSFIMHRTNAARQDYVNKLIHGEEYETI